MNSDVARLKMILLVDTSVQVVALLNDTFSSHSPMRRDKRK